MPLQWGLRNNKWFRNVDKNSVNTLVLSICSARDFSISHIIFCYGTLLICHCSRFYKFEKLLKNIFKIATNKSEHRNQDKTKPTSTDVDDCGIEYAIVHIVLCTTCRAINIDLLSIAWYRAHSKRLLICNCKVNI